MARTVTRRSFLAGALSAGAAGSLTLPGRALACAKLARIRTPFAPVPGGVACTQIYGGPQVARVTGTFRGRPVRATFNRRDGCEIARWDALRFLFR
jgi:hypothetical protein